MKKKIIVLTATRAEYGLLRPIIKALDNQGAFDVRIAVTGAHLSPEFGLTYKEIQNDNISIDKKIEILLSSDTPVSISKSMGLAMISFAEYFEESRPDALMVLGDRYEPLAVCCAAMNARIPVIHLYGGETTEGAVDEAVRHSISKMSYLHFTSTETFRKRVIQLGEAPDRVFNVGAVGIENALRNTLLTRKELEESLKFSLGSDFAVVTFHPVTLDRRSAECQFLQILKAFDQFTDMNMGMKYIFTKSNADADGRIINKMADEYAACHKNAACFDSLGTQRYLSALKECTMVIGNSSSGLIEAPSFKVPTINIGDRQMGRLQADSIINCSAECAYIVEAMETAVSEEFRNTLATVENPYGDGHTSEKIVCILQKELLDKEINLKKRFYDLNFHI